MRKVLFVSMILLILVSLPSMCSGKQEITFQGIFVKSKSTMGILKWLVTVDKVISGPTPQKSPMTVIVAGGVMPEGYIESEIEEGDMVKVHGYYLDSKDPYVYPDEKGHYVKKLYEVLQTYPEIDPGLAKVSNFITVFRKFPRLDNPNQQVLYVEISAAGMQQETKDLLNPLKSGGISFSIDEDVVINEFPLRVYIPKERNMLKVNELGGLPYYSPAKYMPMPKVEDSSLIKDTLKFMAGSLPVVGAAISTSDWVSSVRKNLLEPNLVVPEGSRQSPKTMFFSENERDIIPITWSGNYSYPPGKESASANEKGYESVVVKLPLTFPKNASGEAYEVYIYGNYSVEVPWIGNPSSSIIEYNEVLDLHP